MLHVSDDVIPPYQAVKVRPGWLPPLSAGLVSFISVPARHWLRYSTGLVIYVLNQSINIETQQNQFEEK